MSACSSGRVGDILQLSLFDEGACPEGVMSDVLTIVDVRAYIRAASGGDPDASAFLKCERCGSALVWVPDRAAGPGAVIGTCSDCEPTP